MVSHVHSLSTKRAAPLKCSRPFKPCWWRRGTLPPGKGGGGGYSVCKRVPTAIWLLRGGGCRDTRWLKKGGCQCSQRVAVTVLNVNILEQMIVSWLQIIFNDSHKYTLVGSHMINQRNWIIIILLIWRGCPWASMKRGGCKFGHWKYRSCSLPKKSRGYSFPVGTYSQRICSLPPLEIPSNAQGYSSLADDDEVSYHPPPPLFSFFVCRLNDLLAAADMLARAAQAFDSLLIQGRPLRTDQLRHVRLLAAASLSIIWSWHLLAGRNPPVCHYSQTDHPIWCSPIPTPPHSITTGALYPSIRQSDTAIS